MRRIAPGMGILAVTAVIVTASPTQAQDSRPLPYPVVPPRTYEQAISRGTRSETGEPGPFHWQQWTDYRLNARILPEEKRLEGDGVITYHNRSPFGLRAVILNLYQNHHDSGIARNRTAEITGGVEIARVVVNGEELEPLTDVREPGWVVSGTALQMLLPAIVQPGRSVEFRIEWSFEIPQVGIGGRMGYDDESLFYIAYWYPQMAVFDDVIGWHVDEFLGRAEFYMGYGNYEVTVAAPEGYVVAGTGTLTNADEVLPAEVLSRYEEVAASDSVVHVLTAADLGPGTATRRSEGGYLRWRFSADSVRDFAFAMMRDSRWDATRAPVGDRDGDGAVDYTRINSFWRESAPRWEQQWRYAQQSITFLSRFTGYAYPWPHMTSVEGRGIESGGMEFPMMTLIGPYDSPQLSDTSLYSVTAHELVHMWFPMIVGTNERRHAWMDEGLASFNAGHAGADFYPGRDSIMGTRDGYLALARRGGEGEIMRWSDYHYDAEAYSIASYSKPATLLNTLRGLLGHARFDSIYHDYVRAWALKHPTPWDLFNFINTASGEDLDWFWRSWYYETWTLDQAVAAVEPGDDGTTITVVDRGWVPMPARLTISREDGSTIKREIPVQVWLGGQTSAQVDIPVGAPVVRVEIDAENVFPDIDRGNNIWERPASR